MEIRVSFGTALALGLVSGRAKVLPTTAHIMTHSTNRCNYNCSFCAQAKEGAGDLTHLSRVQWPVFAFDVFFEALKKSNHFSRVCLQVINNDEGERDCLEIARQLEEYHLPVSITTRTLQERYVAELFSLGVDRVALPLDAASEEPYAAVRGGSFKKAFSFLTRCAKKYPGRMVTHLIVGLGESEEEFVNTMRLLHSMDVTIALFAFTPVKGAALQDASPPSYDHYRRIQAAHHFVVNGIDGMRFENGSIVFSQSKEELAAVLKDSAFCTAGCPGCKRPYYTERPGQRLYNYPATPSPEQLEEELNALIVLDVS